MAGMARWSGKLIGFVAGLVLTRRLPVALLGLLIGHAFDEGWFKSATPAAGASDKSGPYRELGLGADASDAEVDAAYKRLISQYHPDKYVAAAPELRAQAERRARELNAAYDRIKKLRRR